MKRSQDAGQKIHPTLYDANKKKITDQNSLYLIIIYNFGES